MRALLLVALVGVVSTAFVQKLTWRESAKTKMIKAGTWAAYKKQIDERVALSRASSDGPPVEKVYDYGDVEYYSMISVGTPPQEFRVVMDTGSPDFWVTTTACSDDACRIKDQFDPSKSSTYQALNETFFVQYGTGYLNGTWGRETVYVGSSLKIGRQSIASRIQGYLDTTCAFQIGGEGDDGVAIPNTAMGFADHLDEFLLGVTQLDGIFGLSFRMSGDEYDPVLVDAIKQDLLKNPIFTTFYEKRGSENNVPGGQITFGDLDQENCGPVIAYQPLSDAEFFKFEIDGLSVGDFEEKRSISVITDTGNSYIKSSSDLGQNILKALNAEEDGPIHVVDCDQKTGIDLTIGGKVYSIDSSNLILGEVGNGKCELAFSINDDLGLMEDFEISLGDPFYRQFCVIHDLQKKQIGFAKPIEKH